MNAAAKVLQLFDIAKFLSNFFLVAVFFPVFQGASVTSGARIVGLLPCQPDAVAGVTDAY